jgi:hypothetical protein
MQQEIKDYLKNNLKIEMEERSNTECNYIVILLKLEGEIIDETQGLTMDCTNNIQKCYNGFGV